MDVRQRTVLLALAGIALGVLATVGVLVLVVRRAAPAAAPTITAQSVSEAAPDPGESDLGARVPEKKVTSKEAGEASILIVERHGVRRVSCEAACATERACGMRPLADCRASSCEGDVRKLNRSDFALGHIKDCAELAAVPCEEACWRRGECTGHHDQDASCTKACATLATQRPLETYRESRCILERACTELPLCGAVDASPQAP